LVTRGLDAGLWFGADSRYYLCGYEYPANAAYQVLVVPLEAPPFIISREHFARQVRASTWIEDCITFPDAGDPIETTRQVLLERNLGTRRLGIEQTALTLTVKTAQALEAALPEARFLDCSGIVEALRLVKSPREIDYMRRAAAISDLGIDAARSIMRPGISERDIAIEVSGRMVAAGSDYQALPTLVGIGEQARLATPLWSDRRLGPGELLWVEVFGTVRRYAAGLKASFGAAPASKDAERRLETAQRAFHAAVAAIKPGRPASVVPAAVHEIFHEAGYGETPHHQSGYSIGISFAPNPHEARILGLHRGNATPLQEGMTLFPIANLYGPGATISASGMVLVTATGAEMLTRFEPRPGDLSR
jgi:Xaa-Pro dipeptidase